MTLELDLLNTLIDAFPNKVSSEELSNRFNCSEKECIRAFCVLADRQYPITYNHNEFSLSLPMVSETKLTNLTGHLKSKYTYIIQESVPSTNTFALNHFSSIGEHSVIMTHHQTKGKGRLGRQWASSSGKSVALSIVLRPSVDATSLPLFTQLTAAALCMSLKKYGNTKIKWPNDILLNGKKIAGILIESHFQENQLQGLVIGVGINTNLESGDFDKVLLDKASSLKMETQKIINPNEVIADFMTAFDSYYTEWMETSDTFSFIHICKKESVLIGKEINVFSPDTPPKQAKVKDINDKGELLVQYEGQNNLTPLQSLNFSVRSKDHYI